jgi:hypothetical protein
MHQHGALDWCVLPKWCGMIFSCAAAEADSVYQVIEMMDFLKLA